MDGSTLHDDGEWDLHFWLESRGQDKRKRGTVRSIPIGLWGKGVSRRIDFQPSCHDSRGACLSQQAVYGLEVLVVRDVYRWGPEDMLLLPLVNL